MYVYKCGVGGGGGSWMGVGVISSFLWDGGTFYSFLLPLFSIFQIALFSSLPSTLIGGPVIDQ